MPPHHVEIAYTKRLIPLLSHKFIWYPIPILLEITTKFNVTKYLYNNQNKKCDDFNLSYTKNKVKIKRKNLSVKKWI